MLKKLTMKPKVGPVKNTKNVKEETIKKEVIPKTETEETVHKLEVSRSMVINQQELTTAENAREKCVSVPSLSKDIHGTSPSVFSKEIEFRTSSDIVISNELQNSETFIKPLEPQVKKSQVKKSLLAQVAVKPKMVPNKSNLKGMRNIDDTTKQKPPVTTSEGVIAVMESVSEVVVGSQKGGVQKVTTIVASTTAAVEYEKLRSPKKSGTQTFKEAGERESVFDLDYDPDVDSSMTSDVDDSGKKNKKKKVRRGTNPEFEEFYNLKEKFLEKLAVEGEDEIDPTQLSISELCFYSHEYIEKLKPKVDELVEKKKKKAEKHAIKGEVELEEDRGKENKVVVKGVEVEKPVEKETEPPEPSGPVVTFDEEGNFQVDMASLEFDTEESLAEKRALEQQTVLYDGRNTDYNRFGKLKKKKKRAVFSPKDTAKFYTALSLIGPNFDKMTQFFPQFTRDDLHNKFKNEDRKNPDFITSLLKNVKFDIDIYGELLDTTDEENDKEEEDGSEKKIKVKKDKDQKKEPKSEKKVKPKEEKKEGLKEAVNKQRERKKRDGQMERNSKQVGDSVPKKSKTKAVKPKGFEDYEPSGGLKHEVKVPKFPKKNARAISSLSVRDDEDTLHDCHIDIDLEASDVEIDTAVFDRLIEKKQSMEEQERTTAGDDEDCWVVADEQDAANVEHDFVAERSSVTIANQDWDEENVPEVQEEIIALKEEHMVKGPCIGEKQLGVAECDSGLVASDRIGNEECQLEVDEHVSDLVTEENGRESYANMEKWSITCEASGDTEMAVEPSFDNEFDMQAGLEPEEILPEEVTPKSVQDELIIPDRKVVIRIKPTGPILDTPVVPQLVTPPAGLIPASGDKSLNAAKRIEPLGSEASVKFVSDSVVSNQEVVVSSVGKAKVDKAPKFKNGASDFVVLNVKNTKREPFSSLEDASETKDVVSKTDKIVASTAKSGMLKKLTSKPIGLVKSKVAIPCEQVCQTPTSSFESPEKSVVGSAAKIEGSPKPLIDHSPLNDGHSKVVEVLEKQPELRIAQGKNKPVPGLKKLMPGSGLLKKLSVKPIVKPKTGEKVRTLSAKGNEGGKEGNSPSPLPFSVMQGPCPATRSGGSEKAASNSDNLARDFTSLEQKSKLGKSSPKATCPVVSRSVTSVKRVSRIQKFEDSESSESEEEVVTPPVQEQARAQPVNSDTSSKEREQPVTERVLASAQSGGSVTRPLLSGANHKTPSSPVQCAVKRKLPSFKDRSYKVAKVDDCLQTESSQPMSVKDVGPPTPSRSADELERLPIPASAIRSESLRELANVPAGSLVLVEVPHPNNPNEKVIQVFQKLD